MKTLFVLSVFLFSVQVTAHAHLVASSAVAPRDPNGNSIKVGPCGNVARISTPATLTAGQTITVNWVETINHPGRFEFYFSTGNDANFVLLKTVTDTQDSGALPHSYSTTLTLPNTTCSACTLQMIQVMTENPTSPSNYYSCADIVLQAAPGATPSPQPEPDPSCIDSKVSLTK